MSTLTAFSPVEAQIDAALLQYARVCFANDFGTQPHRQDAYLIRRQSLYRHLCGLFTWFDPVSFGETLARLYHDKKVLVVQDDAILFFKPALAGA